MTIVKMKFVWVITWKLMVSGGNEPLVGENENLVGGGVFFSGYSGISFGGFATEIVWTHLISSGDWGEGGWTSDQISKKRGLAGSQFVEGVAGKDRVIFFRGLQFLHKRETKVWKIYWQKIYKQKCFSIITKNSIWILTKNLVNFKRRDRG